MENHGFFGLLTGFAICVRHGISGGRKGFMKGKIIKGIAGFYYVQTKDSGIYTCKAKGIFRRLQIKPLVGDNVELSVQDEAVKEGNVDRILPRENTLLRPAVANIHQALVVFAIRRPDPNFNLLDRFLVMMEQQGLKSILCFNKSDLSSREEEETIRQMYESGGYRVVFTCAMDGTGIPVLKELLRGSTTTVAGPSGVGKSSLVNLLQPKAQMETGAISEKIARGKNTTRHSELICIEEDTYIMDTPGFSSLGLFQLEKEQLRHYYPEFTPFEGTCRFQGCVHVHEPDCKVREALAEGKINKIRYDNYCLLYEEVKGQRRYSYETRNRRTAQCGKEHSV